MVLKTRRYSDAFRDGYLNNLVPAGFETQIEQVGPNDFVLQLYQKIPREWHPSNLLNSFRINNLGNQAE